MYLDKINSPSDLKKLNIYECNKLADEIRDAFIKKMSVCGGHFGPNMGIVELTIALHYVFNSPHDKFIFDVSHQCYCHKLLTGRKDAFLNEDKYKSITGYTCPEESEHDIFNVGHTSTSVSLACGLAKARDQRKEVSNIVAIIGDGSLSGGISFEGLDYAVELNSNLIIVVNDNDMSIAENHGGIYKNLRKLRETKGEYKCNYFKAIGLDYIYIDEGNDIETLVEVFKKIKDIDRPIVVHINTIKGFGYKIAENNKEDWHWRPPFHIENGDFKNHFTNENYDNIVCDYLMDKMKKDKNVVTVVAAVPACIGFSEEKRKEAGSQFVDVGIAEEHAILMSAGIARNGGKVVFATHSSFFQRAYDQISQEVCINKAPVTLLVRNASVFGMNDVTHLGIFDIPLLANIPNLVYLAPTNKQEYLAMLDWSIEQNSYPVAIRIPRNGVHNTSEPVDTDYSDINKYKITNVGEDIAVIALGDFYQLGEELVQYINSSLNINATLMNPRYITGIDKIALDKLAENHSIVVTLEDGILEGGFGEKIASYYGKSSIKVLNYGLKKEFIDGYIVSQVLEDNRLTVDQIFDDICAVKKQMEG